MASSNLLQGTKKTNIVIDYFSENQENNNNSGSNSFSSGSGNDFVSSLLNSNTPTTITATNSFVVNKNLDREEKVYHLLKLCEPHIDQLYECEMTNGFNSDLCNSFQTNLHNCMTGKLCPSEQELKDSQCDQLYLRFGGVDQLNRCLDINKRLNNCLDKSLQFIWSTPLSNIKQQEDDNKSSFKSLAQ